MSSENVAVKQDIVQELLKLKEAIEKTLMDFRELMNNLENPFNYIALLSQQISEHGEQQLPKQVSSKSTQESNKTTSQQAQASEHSTEQRESTDSNKGVEVVKEVLKSNKKSSRKTKSKKNSGALGDLLAALLLTRGLGISNLLSQTSLPQTSLLDGTGLLQANLVPLLQSFASGETRITTKRDLLEFVQVLINLYILAKVYRVDLERVERILSVLHEHGLISRREYELYEAALEILSEIVDETPEDFVKVLCSILKMSGLDTLSRILMYTLGLSKTYSIEVV